MLGIIFRFIYRGGNNKLITRLLVNSVIINIKIIVWNRAPGFVYSVISVIIFG